MITLLSINFSIAQSTFSYTYGGLLGEEGQAAKQTADGGYIMIGTTTSFGVSQAAIYLVRSDGMGQIIWEQTIDSTGVDIGMDVIETNDEQLIFLGLISQETLVLIKKDTNGGTVWSTTFPDAIGWALEATNDGGVIVVGSAGSWSAGNILLLKVSSNGNIEWSNAYPMFGIQQGFDIKVTPDQGYIITGKTGWVADDHIFLMKTDSSGIMDWYEEYTSPSDERAYGVDYTNDGGYVVGGSTSGVSSKIKIIKADSIGNIIWEKEFLGENNGESAGFDIVQTTDQGYILAGLQINSNCNCTEFTSIKTDELGDLQWYSSHPLGFESYAYCAQETSDGGYILFGTGADSTIYSHQMYLVKVNAQGILTVPEIQNGTRSIDVHPNPFTQSISLKDAPPNSIYAIYNITGALVAVGSVVNKKIGGLGHLPTGFYTLVIDTEGILRRQKLMKE